MQLKAIFTLVGLCLALFAQAQTTTPTTTPTIPANKAIRVKRLELSLHIGQTPYQGDVIVPRFSFKSGGPAVKWDAGYVFSPYFSLHGDAFLSTYSAFDKDFGREKRNFGTVASAIGASIYGAFSLRKMMPPQQGWRISPITTLGVGGMIAETTVSGLPIDSPDLKNTSAQTLFGSFGIGLQALNWEGWCVSAEIRKLWTPNDYLDGISISGNPNQPDGLVFIGLGFGKRF